jgi:hypothetical protein
MARRLVFLALICISRGLTFIPIPIQFWRRCHSHRYRLLDLSSDQVKVGVKVMHMAVGESEVPLVVSIST